MGHQWKKQESRAALKNGHRLSYLNRDHCMWTSAALSLAINLGAAQVPWECIPMSRPVTMATNMTGKHFSLFPTTTTPRIPILKCERRTGMMMIIRTVSEGQVISHSYDPKNRCGGQWSPSNLCDHHETHQSVLYFCLL